MNSTEEVLAMDADEAREAERRRRLIEERRMKTYLAHAEASANDEAGGRFAALPEKKPTVIGAKAEISYPQQPEGSPWHSDPCGDEPLIDGSGEGDRLGYRIDGGPDPSPEPEATSVSGTEAVNRSASSGSTHKQRLHRRF
jgi:hypothetical protein